MNIESQIKDIIKERGLSLRQFAQEIDLPYTTLITMLQNGIKKSNVNNANKLLGALGLTFEGLYDKNPSLNIFTNDAKSNKIPLIGRIAAGLPIFAEENIEDYFTIDDSIKADFCLKVKGESMIDEAINDGDIVFIKKQDTLENGEIGAILVEDEATLKTFYREGNTIVLQPANKDFPPMIFTQGNIKILGKLAAVLNLRDK